MISYKRINALKEKINLLNIKSKSMKFIVIALEGVFFIDSSTDPIKIKPVNNIIEGYEMHDLRAYSINRIVISNCINDTVIIAVRQIYKRCDGD